MLVVAMLAMQAVASDAEREALGIELARSGVVAAILPLTAAKETDELVAAHPELTPAEQAELRRTAASTLADETATLMAAEGHVYAQELSLAELNALVAFNKSAIAVRFRSVRPCVIAGVMHSASGIDFKGDTLKAFCAATGKACEKK